MSVKIKRYPAPPRRANGRDGRAGAVAAWSRPGGRHGTVVRQNIASLRMAERPAKRVRHGHAMGRGRHQRPSVEQCGQPLARAGPRRLHARQARPSGALDARSSRDQSSRTSDPINAGCPCDAGHAGQTRHPGKACRACGSGGWVESAPVQRVAQAGLKQRPTRPAAPPARSVRSAPLFRP